MGLDDVLSGFKLILSEFELILNQIETEIGSMKSVKKGQQQAMDEIESEDVTDEYLQRVKDNLRKAKNECRQLNEECRNEDKVTKAQHSKIVELEDK